MSEKCLNCWNDSLVPTLAAKLKVLLMLPEIFSRFVLLHLKNRASLKYFVSDFVWKPFFDSNSPQTSSNLSFLIFL